MLVESIEMIERIWASDPPYDLGGTYWTTRIKDTVNPAMNFGWLPKPYQKPRPPIAIPCSTPDSASVKAAARKGWSVISSALLSNDDLAKHWTMYRQGCEEAGRPANGSDWRICRTVHVAATDDEARARVYGAESGYRQRRSGLRGKQQRPANEHHHFGRSSVEMLFVVDVVTGGHVLA